jgi:CheY-like chemotaxis protein
MTHAVDRGAALTSRLLAFSRKQPLSPVSADIAGLIRGLEDMFRRTLGETIDLRIANAPDLGLAMIDPHQFEDALLNLAINARHAMPDGGALVIETANATLDQTYAEQQQEVTPGDYVEVAVSDTGSGMPPEVLERSFEPFFTTKEVGMGSGLGLSMVYGFAKQSNGHVVIYSEVGHGTTVRLYLPRSGEAVDQEDAMAEAAKPERGSERILVVEDDPSVRGVPVKILRKQGYQVVEAEDGEAAIKLLQDDGPFDLLFTDIVLPGGMSGIEIAMEAARIQPSIKVLYTTGYAESAVIERGYLDPAATLVNKPYRRAELLEKVRTMLDSNDV